MEELLQIGDYAKERATLAFAEGSSRLKRPVSSAAKKQCRARSDHNVKMAFNLGDLPPLITKEEAGQRLLAMRDVIACRKDLQEWALSECLAGNEVPGWKAVEEQTIPRLDGHGCRLKN